MLHGQLTRQNAASKQSVGVEAAITTQALTITAIQSLHQVRLLALRRKPVEGPPR